MVLGSAPTMRLLLTALALSALAGCADDVPYKNCSRVDICGGGTTPLCLSTTAPSGRTALFCTARCTTPAASAPTTECPDNSACVAVNGGGPYCLLRCAADTDCPFTNAACLVTADSMGTRVCTVRP